MLLIGQTMLSNVKQAAAMKVEEEGLTKEESKARRRAKTVRLACLLNLHFQI